MTWNFIKGVLLIGAVAGFCAFFLFGCQAAQQSISVSPPNFTRSTGNIEKAGAQADNARKIIEALIKNGTENVELIKFNLGVMLGSLQDFDRTQGDVSADAIRSNDEWTKAWNQQAVQVNQVSNQLAMSRQELADERGHWWGYKSRTSAPWLIGAAVTLIVAYEVAAQYLQGGVFAGVLGLFGRLVGIGRK